MESLLAGIALVRRRYTGETEQVVRCGDGLVRVDLTEDRPVRELLAGLPVPPGTVAHDFPAELTEPMTADLAAILAAMAADPDQSTADLLPVAEYERRRPVWPATPLPDLGATIPEAFAAVVARHPDRLAVQGDDDGLTYRELGSAVAATAAALGPGGPVAILCEHGASTVIGLLAALTAGRPYVPLDPTYPRQRLVDTLADSGADVLITDATQRDLANRLAGRTIPIVHCGHSGADTVDEVLAGLRSTARPDDPAYLLYTSGSTGVPKGVVQSHRNVLFGIANHVRNFGITPEDRTSVLTSFGYDMAVTDTFGALLSGAAAVPVDIRTHGLGHLADLLARRRVTVYHSTPTVYRYLCASLGANGTLPAIRAVLLGGEEVIRHDVELARRHFAPDAVFVNGYGTTEISFATQYHLPAGTTDDHAVVPIGHPLDGIDVLLVDPAGRPACLTGEIMVRCPHVALGYWRRPELTAARFVEHRGVRAYLTGDLARRLPDGRLVYLGRRDRMVKIRGHRVELGEVESRMAGLPGVAHAAVVSRENPKGDKEIIGYVVPSGPVDPAAIRGALAEALPDFMLPRAIVALPALPVGVTGKLDVDALPPPPDPSAVDDPLDPVERVITAAWREVLGVLAVDRHTSFVAMGGHSLQLALIQQRLEGELDVRLPLARLVEFPTVAGLAEHLRTGTPVADPAVTRAAERMRRRREARQ